MTGGITLWKDRGYPVEVPRTLTPEQRERYSPPPAAPRGRRRRPAEAARRQGAAARRRRARLADRALPRRRRRRHDRHRRRRRRRRLEPPAPGDPHHRAASACRRSTPPRRRSTTSTPTSRSSSTPTRLDASNIMEIIEGYDMIVDGVDNFPTRYLLNDATVRLRHPGRLGLDPRLRRPAQRLQALRGPVLPLPLPPAAAGRARAVLRRQRRARRAAGHDGPAAGDRGRQADPRRRRAADRPPADVRRARRDRHRAQGPARPRVPDLLARPRARSPTTSWACSPTTRRSAPQRDRVPRLMATIRIPPVLRPSVGGEREVSADGDTVGDVLRSLADAHPETAASCSTTAASSTATSTSTSTTRTCACSTGSRRPSRDADAHGDPARHGRRRVSAMSRPVAARPAAATAARLRGVAGSAVRDILALTERPGVISFAGGLPEPGLFDTAGLRAAFARALGDDAARRSLQYSTTEGDPRAARADRRAAHRRAACRRSRGRGARHERLAAGADARRDAAARARVASCSSRSPPTSPRSRRSSSPARGSCPVACDDDGLVPEALEAAVRRERPVLLYTVPTFQNPTGRTLPAERRARDRADRRRARAVDPRGRPLRRAALRRRARRADRRAARGRRPRARALDAVEDRRARPAHRLGAGARERAPLARHRQAGRGPAHLDRRSGCERRSGSARSTSPAHMRAPARRLSRAPRCAARRARRRRCPPGSTWNVPGGGMFVWARLPDGQDASALLDGGSGAGCRVRSRGAVLLWGAGCGDAAAVVHDAFAGRDRGGAFAVARCVGLGRGRGSRGAWRARADRGRTHVLAPTHRPRHASTISRSSVWPAMSSESRCWAPVGSRRAGRGVEPRARGARPRRWWESGRQSRPSLPPMERPPGRTERAEGAF